MLCERASAVPLRGGRARGGAGNELGFVGCEGFLGWGVLLLFSRGNL
jgi:hypothetical protein